MPTKFFVIFLIFFTGNAVNGKLTEAEKFFQTKNCDSKCSFNAILNSTNIGSFPNCTKVCAYILINQYTGVSETKLTSAFKNMKVLIGSLVVQNTNFTGAKFLTTLEEIQCDDIGITFSQNINLTDTGLINLKTADCPSFFVLGGDKMTGLNMPKFEKITYNETSEIAINILAPLSLFCITVSEMRAFISTRTPSSIGITTQYCEPSISPKLCQKPAEGCLEMFGDVEIGPDFNMTFMKNVEIIYGNLVVNGTQLTNFDVFQSLMYIATLGYGVTALDVVGNPNLVNSTFPMLKRIYSNSLNEINFNGNAEELLLDPNNCYGLRSLLCMETQDAPNMDGESCEQVALNAPGRKKTYMEARSMTTTASNLVSARDNLTMKLLNLFSIFIIVMVMMR